MKQKIFTEIDMDKLNWNKDYTIFFFRKILTKENMQKEKYVGQIKPTDKKKPFFDEFELYFDTEAYTAVVEFQKERNRVNRNEGEER